MSLPSLTTLTSTVDIFLGVLAALFLHLNRLSIAHSLTTTVKFYTRDVFVIAIKWLMGWPAGFKLNAPVDKFLGGMYLWMMYEWSGIIFYVMYNGVERVKILEGHEEYLIQAIGLLSLCGVSVLISSLSDILLLFTLHIRLFFYISSRMQHWSASCMYSLFLLFRGKKWNRLKERVDSQDFSLDQLLLGTVLFSVLVFLYPTFLFYHLLFISVHLCIFIFRGEWLFCLCK